MPTSRTSRTSNQRRPLRPEEARRLASDRLRSALSSRYGIEREVALTKPRLESFGDVSSRIALEAAGPAGAKPREIAEALASDAALPEDVFASISVEGPGYINLSFSLAHLCSVTSALASEGLVPMMVAAGSGRTALVEYVSSNPTGPLNIGHCRQAVLGEAVAGLLEATGWRVEREYYFNDAGRQSLLLGESLAARYAELHGDSHPVPEGGYRGEYLLWWARDLAGERGSALEWPADSGLFVDYARTRAMEMIKGDLAVLGVEFDRYFSESSLIPEAVGEALEALGRIETPSGPLIYEEPEGSGKLWARLTALGRPEDRVLLRENGVFTYRMPDIAYHLDKFGRGYDLMVDIFGSDHLDTSKDVVALLSALLGEEEVSRRLRVILHQFVTLVRDGRKVKMSTRAANFVTLRDLVEEAGSPDVTRYLFLTRRAEAQMDFDLELARRQSDDNPVYYVQYACARISGILRNALAEGLSPATGGASVAPLLAGADERSLMRLLEAVPVRTAAAAAALEPHRLTEILHDLAVSFHGFYQRVRVVDRDEPEVSRARLMLCSACRNTMRDLLGILGVEAPERM